MVRWLPIVDQPINFTLVANSATPFRLGAISQSDFDAFLVRQNYGGHAKARLALRGAGVTAKRVCRIPADAIDHSARTIWPGREATGQGGGVVG
jgi:hypothetical protein